MSEITPEIYPLSIRMDNCEIIATDIELVRSKLLEPDFLAPLCEHVEREARALVADPTTIDGRKQIKENAAWVKKASKRLDDFRKNVVEELKRRPKVIDDNVRPYRVMLEKLSEELLAPVTEIDNRLSRIEVIATAPAIMTASTSAELRAKIAEIEALDVSIEQWKESHKEATEATAKALARLGEMLAERITKEREQAEFEAYQKAKQEQELRDKIAKEERAKLEREQAEKERKQAQATAPTPAPQSVNFAPIQAPKPQAPKVEAPAVSVYDEAYDDLKATFVSAGYKDPIGAVLNAIIHGKIRHIKMGV
jgi:hypothetical protein